MDFLISNLYSRSFPYQVFKFTKEKFMKLYFHLWIIKLVDNTIVNTYLKNEHHYLI